MCLGKCSKRYTTDMNSETTPNMCLACYKSGVAVQMDKIKNIFSMRHSKKRKTFQFIWDNVTGILFDVTLFVNFTSHGFCPPIILFIWQLHKKTQ